MQIAGKSSENMLSDSRETTNDEKTDKTDAGQTFSFQRFLLVITFFNREVQMFR